MPTGEGPSRPWSEFRRWSYDLRRAQVPMNATPLRALGPQNVRPTYASGWARPAPRPTRFSSYMAGTNFRPSGGAAGGVVRNIVAPPGRFASLGRNWMHNMSQASVFSSAVINVGFGVAMTYGNAISESARWGATTGHQEDYVGGWVAGKSQGLSRAIGLGVGELVGTAIGAFIPVPLAAPVLGIVGSLVGEPIAAFVTRRGSYEKGRLAARNAAGAIAKRKVQFGRGFVDNQEAYTMRQMAVQEMSGSLLNARQYLGNEAFFMHQ